MTFIFAAPARKNEITNKNVLYQPVIGFAIIVSLSTHAYTKFSASLSLFLCPVKASSKSFCNVTV